VGKSAAAIVTGASDKGTWVRLQHPTVEGKLTSGYEGMDIGHRLRVQLIHTDVDRGYNDFKKVELAELVMPVPSHKAHRNVFGDPYIKQVLYEFEASSSQSRTC
jgi:hypothetical protein